MGFRLREINKFLFSSSLGKTKILDYAFFLKRSQFITEYFLSYFTSSETRVKLALILQRCEDVWWLQTTSISADHLHFGTRGTSLKLKTLIVKTHFTLHTKPIHKSVILKFGQNF